MLDHQNPLEVGQTRQLLTYSAKTQRLFALASTHGGGSALSVWTEDRGWESRREQLREINTPVGIAITPRDEQLIVLDMHGPRSPLRFFSLDPEQGKLAFLGEMANPGADKSAMTFGRDGRLLLAMSREQKTELLHMRTVEGKLVIVDSYQTDGRLLGELVEDGAAATFTVMVGDKPEVRTAELRSFQVKK